MAFLVGDRNRRLGPESFEYRKCSSCSCIALEHVPENLGSYYALDGYGSGQDQITPELEARERAKLALVLDRVPPTEMIEIGPGPGLFTRVAKSAGFSVTAIEMDANYCRNLEDVLGVRAIHSDTPAEAVAGLDPAGAIVMWHVLEHLPEPWRLLEHCAETLAPGGVIAISTPNPQSLQFRLMGARWLQLDAPRHLQLIPFSTLEERLAGLGLRCVARTTTDPVGRELDRMGWESAMRLTPGRKATRFSMGAARLLTGLMAGIERRGLHGSTYTCVFAATSGLRDSPASPKPLPGR